MKLLLNNVKMKKLVSLIVVLILITGCERKSGRGRVVSNQISNSEITRANEEILDDCICDDIDCDYCVKVVAITDGDTFRGLTQDKEEVRYRIYGIDAPENKQAFGNRSKQHLSDLIFGKTVGIKLDKIDFFGRPVVWVYTPDGKDVSAEMIMAGMAWHYKKYDKTGLYNILEIGARSEKKGLWIDKNPIPPWDFRKKK